MAAQVVANGPISFSDTDGLAFSIPLSILYVDDNGTIKADSWPPYDEYQSLIDPWLAYLQEQGLIRQGEASAPVTAMIVKAKTTGAAGNTILLEINNLHPDPADNSVTLFDVTVTENNTYSGLSPATLKAMLGTAAGGGEKPGLVFVSSAGDPEMPKAGSYPLMSGAGNTAASVEVPNADESATAFKVSARSKGAEGNRTTVTIEDVTATAFTLVAEWTKTSANLKPGDVAGSFDYEITVDPPQDGALATPAAGDYTLNGGVDAQPAKPATVTLAAGS